MEGKEKGEGGGKVVTVVSEPAGGGRKRSTDILMVDAIFLDRESKKELAYYVMSA